MNSSKLSLKEGFDFLFEEKSEDEPTTQNLVSKDFSSKDEDDKPSSTDNQKITIQGLDQQSIDELSNPGGVADAVANILAFDGIIRKGAGRKSTMALRGELFNKVFTSINNSRQQHIRMIQNFVATKAQAEALLKIYDSSLSYLQEKGFDRFKALVEAKQITTTTKGADVLDAIMDKFSNQINFKILKERIFEKLQQIVPNLKDDISGKSAGAEKLSADDVKFISGVSSKLNRLVNSDPKTKEDLKDTLAQFGELSVKLAAIAVQYRNNEDVQGEVNDLNDVLNNFRSQIQDSTKDLQDETEDDLPILDEAELDALLADIDSKFESTFNDADLDDSDKQGLQKLKDDIGNFVTQTLVSQEDFSEEEESDEPAVIEEDEVNVQTTLSTPEDGDFNDFVRKYAAIAAFISFKSEDAGRQLISDSAQNLKAGQLVNLLRMYAKEVGESNRKVLEDSINNLEKFTNTNVDGIIFERAGSSKYFIKIDKKKFIGGSFVIKKAMKIHSPEDAFNDTIVDSFITPDFELTDSAGNNLFTTIHGAKEAFKNADTSKKRIEFKKGEKVKGRNLDKLVFSIENKPLMELRSNLILYIVNSNINDAFINFAQLGSSTLERCNQLGLSEKQTITVQSFIRSISEKDEKSIDDVLNKEKISDKAKQQIGDAAKSALLPQEPATQQLTSKKSRVEQRQSINSVDDLLNHKDIRTMMSKLYKDKSLMYAISSMNDTQIVAIRNGGEDERNKAQAMLISSLNPDLSAIKREIRNLCSDGSEIRGIFDGVMFNKTFNEEAFKGAYGALIISAVDKIVRSKDARITEGFFSKAISLVKATAGNIVTPILLMKGIGWLVGAAAMATAAPYLTALATGLAAKSLYDVRKWTRESEQYRDNPIKYIEGLLDDSKTKKSTQGLVNVAISDIVIKAIDPTHKSPQLRTGAGQVGAKSQFSAEIETFSSNYNALSKEEKAQLKDLNDHVLKQISLTRYYNQGIITDSIINVIFNKVFFGENRISDDCRKELLTPGTHYARNLGNHGKEFQEKLIKAVSESSAKNNFIDYIERHARSNNRKGALTMGSEKEIAERGNKTWYGMRKSAFLSTEQINQKYFGELFMDIIGMKLELYDQDLKSYGVNWGSGGVGEDRMEESIQNKNLVNLLFEDDAKSKQKAHDREVDVAVAASTAIPWYISAHKMFLTKIYLQEGLNIDKFAEATPGGGQSGLFGYKITAQLPKLINTVFRNPQEAAAIGKAGGDGFGPQFQLNNGKFLQSYYWNGKAAIGTKKALSMIIGKTGVNAKTIGHYPEVAKNVEYLKTLGLDVDLEKGIVKAIPGSGCIEIDPSNPLFNANVKTMATSLEGAVKAQEQNPYAWNAYNSAAKLMTDGTWSQKSVAKMSSHMLQQLMNKSLQGDLGDVSDLDPMFKNYITKDIVGSLISGKKLKIQMTSGNLGDVTPEDLSMTSKALLNGLQQVVNDYKAAAVKMKVALADRGMIQGIIDDEQGMSAAAKAFNKTMIKSMNDNIFNKTVTGSGIKITDVIQNLNNDEAHAGLNLTMKKALVGGGFSAQKLLGTEAIREYLGTTGDYFEGGIGGKPIPVEIPDGVNWKALGMKSAMWALIPTKIMTTFAQRGVQGGKFAEFFWKMFSPHKKFISDMRHVICGHQMASPEAMAKFNGAFSGQDVKIDIDFSMPNEGNSAMEMPVSDLSSLSSSPEGDDQSRRQRGESFVYKNNIADFLFESKLNMRSDIELKKKSSLKIENKEFDLFKKEFKKIFK